MNMKVAVFVASWQNAFLFTLLHDFQDEMDEHDLWAMNAPSPPSKAWLQCIVFSRVFQLL